LSETVHHSADKKNIKPMSPPTPRPRSLYVPFIGYVEAPPLPPGKEARDILMALSFAPIERSYRMPTTTLSFRS
jgi:hypothetical protein